MSGTGSDTALLEPLLTGGLRSVNFFNGRLLTADDLSAEQAANDERACRYGRALGSGIIEGLEVAASASGGIDSPTVTVEAGMAMSPSGRVLTLPTRVSVSLVRGSPVATGATTPGLFADCTPPSGGAWVAGAGLYVLAVGAVRQRQGRAQTNGLPAGSPACATDVMVDGVQLRLVEVNYPVTAFGDPERLRNRVAHSLFGTNQGIRLMAATDPFGAVPATWGLLDEVRNACLSADEVPIAALAWTSADGLLFVDMWAVRRRVTREAVAARWTTFVDDRVLAEGEAVFCQFQDEVDDLVASPESLAGIVAHDRFDFLPALGVIPAATDQADGFDLNTFFGLQSVSKPSYLNGVALEGLVRASFQCAPIEVEGDEPLQLYFITDNVRAFQAGATSRLAAVFASAALPYRGTARFDFSAFGEGRFVPSF